MAERPTLADLLLGRGLPSADLSRDERRDLDRDLSRSHAWGALMPQSREEWAHHNPDLRTFLPGFQGGHDLARGIGEGSPGTAAWGAGQILLSLLPLGFRAPTPRAPVAQGPWTPGHMDRWVASRYRAPDTQRPWRPDQRWGRVEYGLRDALLDASAGRLPPNARAVWQATRPLVVGGVGAGIGGGLASYGADTLWRGRDWNDPRVLYRALINPLSPPDVELPSWWPRPETAGGRGE